MPEAQPNRSSDGEPLADGSPSDSHAAANPAEDLGKLVQEVRLLCTQLATDVAQLAAAQWRLTSYIVAGSTRIWATRVAVMVVIGALALGSWVFLNVALWCTVAEATIFPSAPPLALFLLHTVAALILYRWQKGLTLQ